MAKRKLSTEQVSEEIGSQNMEPAAHSMSNSSSSPKKSSKKFKSGASETPKSKRKSLDAHTVAPDSTHGDEQPNRPSKRKKSISSEGKEGRETNGHNVEEEPVPSEHRASNANTSGRLSSPEIRYPDSEEDEARRRESLRRSTPWETPKSTDAKKGKSGRTIGHFKDDIKVYEAFKEGFCKEYGISSMDFNAMVQHSDRSSDGSPFPNSALIEKPNFWKAIYLVMPQRDKRSVYRFMRRHFLITEQKPHEWTEEQDRELISLFKIHGPKWVTIAKAMDKHDDDVSQRWRNRLEHRNTMRQGSWAPREEHDLQHAVQQQYNKIRQMEQDKKVLERLHGDIWEMDDVLISWTQVSKALEYCRSRQQCADKFRKIRHRVFSERHQRGNPNWMYEPLSEQGQWKYQAPKGGKRAIFKSSNFVTSEDDSSDVERPEEPAGTGHETATEGDNNRESSQQLNDAENEPNVGSNFDGAADTPENQSRKKSKKSKKEKKEKKKQTDGVSTNPEESPNKSSKKKSKSKSKDKHQDNEQSTPSKPEKLHDTPKSERKKKKRKSAKSSEHESTSVPDSQLGPSGSSQPSGEQNTPKKKSKKSHAHHVSDADMHRIKREAFSPSNGLNHIGGDDDQDDAETDDAMVKRELPSSSYY